MNFVEFLFENSRFSDQEFIAGTGEKITFRELYDRVEDLSRWMAREHGSGNEVLILADNSVFFVLAYLATMRSGNVPLLVETRISGEDLAALMSACHPLMAFVQRRLAAKAVPGLPTLTEDDLPEAVAEDVRARVSEDDLAVVVFTSGSTGNKKGVMITHGNLIANTSSIVEYLDLTAEDRMMVVLPFYYCYGASLLHTHLRAGGSLVLSQSIFLGAVLADIDRYECTGLAGVPSTFQILMARTKFLERRFPTLRYMTQAGGRLEPKAIIAIADAFPDVRFYVMYGATEATARLSYLPPDLLRSKTASIGKGISGVSLEVLDENGRPVRPGQTGEVVAAGRNIMKGYYGDEEGTREVLTDGRYRTGDLATVDEDGYIYIVGRARDIIKCAGYRVSPYEIESVVAAADGVDTSAVVGVPDDLLGEAIVAAVLRKGGTSEEEVKESVLARCRQALPSYKVPKLVVFLEEMPLNSSNKVDKIRIRQMLARGELPVR
ncbi:MAG: AMP-binding protein [Methanomassiliicoccus sp.]|nr:AMP-binding protein [Methanomassiliicoccus sp.]